jgi:hypothetical protein
LLLLLALALWPSVVSAGGYLPRHKDDKSTSTAKVSSYDLLGCDDLLCSDEPSRPDVPSQVISECGENTFNLLMHYRHGRPIEGKISDDGWQESTIEAALQKQKCTQALGRFCSQSSDLRAGARPQKKEIFLQRYPQSWAEAVTMFERANEMASCGVYLQLFFYHTLKLYRGSRFKFTLSTAYDDMSQRDLF